MELSFPRKRIKSNILEILSLWNLPAHHTEFEENAWCVWMRHNCLMWVEQTLTVLWVLSTFPSLTHVILPEAPWDGPFPFIGGDTELAGPWQSNPDVSSLTTLLACLWKKVIDPLVVFPPIVFALEKWKTLPFLPQTFWKICIVNHVDSWGEGN